MQMSNEEWLHPGLTWLDQYDRGHFDIPPEPRHENVIFLDTEDIMALHVDLMGEQGVLRDGHALDSALARAENALAYGNITVDQAGWLLAEGIVKNHPFNNGNKRTALLALVAFARRNNITLPKDSVWLAQKILRFARSVE